MDGPRPASAEPTSAPNGGTARYPDVVLRMRSVSVLFGSALAQSGPQLGAPAALHGEAEPTLFSDGLRAVALACRRPDRTALGARLGGYLLVPESSIRTPPSW